MALGVPYIVVLAIVGLGLGLVIDRPADPDDPGLAAGVLAWTGLQLGLGTWPLIVARWKGFGAAADWGLRFRLVDLPLGVGTAIIALGAGGVVATLVSVLVGLDDQDEVTNTDFLADAAESPWLLLLLAMVVFVGPTAEELFFRGLLLRALERRTGIVLAVIISTALFTLAHYTGAGLGATAVMAGVIGTAGLIFAVVAIQVGRLGPSIVAHVLFNALAAGVALGTGASSTPT